MRTVIVAGIVGLLCAVGAAGAQDAGPGVSMQAADVVAGRRAALNLSGAAMGGMKATIDAGGSVRSQAMAAGGVARWARALPGMFPAGTGMADLPEGATNAKAEIWTDRAGFEAKAASYAAEAQKLADLARADDAAGVAAQWTVVRATCQACHDSFKN
jgi:cytochrome c556